MFSLNLIKLVLFFLIFFPSIAYSYLDPGTGSYLIQILVAAIFGSLFALKMFWGRIKAFFQRKKTDEE